MVTLDIHNVADEAVGVLQAWADAASLSLSDCVQGVLEDSASRPTVEELMEPFASHPVADVTTATEVLDDERADH